MKIDSIRREYSRQTLSKNQVNKNPFTQFRKWIKEAIISKIPEPTAMSVATLGTDGFPQSRIVLLKYFDETGFVFFTHYQSQKGISIENNPKVSLLFFWPELERQIRITGIAEKTADEISDNYFYSRPVASQISAVVSEQSREIVSRQFLEERVAEFLEQNKNRRPERPESWGGYVVKPVRFEFWQGRESRLHDRIKYEKQDNRWMIKRLAP